MVKPSNETPVLLILDNHSSHLSLAAIELARANGVVLLSLAPHTSHRKQSLDTGFFGPLKKAYAVACDNWQVSNPGRAITQFQVARLFGTAYLKVASIQRAQKSFESCGIWPFNDQVFTDEDFAPADVTDRPYLNAETVGSHALHLGIPRPSETSGVQDIEEPTETVDTQALEAQLSPSLLRVLPVEGLEEFVHRSQKTPDLPDDVHDRYS